MEIHLGGRVLPTLFTVLAVCEDNPLVANLRKENWTAIEEERNEIVAKN